MANTLGEGFLEKVYEKALTLEIRSHGLAVGQQHGIVAKYRGTDIGQDIADILAEESVIIELKATKFIGPAQLARCRDYLKATGLRLCLLINFGGPKVPARRIVLNL